MAAVDEGVPVAGYWHWSLVDNYEWGSYEPRFGLYGVDRHRGEHGMRWLETDSLGDDCRRHLPPDHRRAPVGDRSVLDRGDRGRGGDRRRRRHREPVASRRRRGRPAPARPGPRSG